MKCSNTDDIISYLLQEGYSITSLKRAPSREWNKGVIKAIYEKKGDKKCPANYRGITLTSCLGKLFTSILQNRLNKFIQQHNILNPEQFEFRPYARTTDSPFILRQLLHRYTKQHKKLYVGFIDYEKAFDSV